MPHEPLESFHNLPPNQPYSASLSES
jgi:hypothetical protein